MCVYLIILSYADLNVNYMHLDLYISGLSMDPWTNSKRLRDCKIRINSIYESLSVCSICIPGHQGISGILKVHQSLPTPFTNQRLVVVLRKCLWVQNLQRMRTQMRGYII